MISSIVLFLGGFVGFGNAVHVNTTETVTSKFASVENPTICTEFKFEDLQFIAEGGNGKVYKGKVSPKFFDGDTVIKFGTLPLTDQVVVQSKKTNAIVTKLREESSKLFDGEVFVLGTVPYSKDGCEQDESLKKKLGFEPEWIQVQPFVNGMSVEQYSKTMKPKLSGESLVFKEKVSQVALKAGIRMLQIAAVMWTKGVRHNDFHLDNVLLVDVKKESFDPATLFYSDVKVKVIDLDTMDYVAIDESITMPRDASYDINLMESFSYHITGIMQDNEIRALNLARHYIHCIITRVCKKEEFHYTFRDVKGIINLSSKDACINDNMEEDAVKSWNDEWTLIGKVSRDHGPQLGTVLTPFAESIRCNK